MGLLKKIEPANLVGSFLLTVSLVMWIVIVFPVSAAYETNAKSRLKSGILLFAVPELRDPNFLHTVVLLMNYEKGGAMGLIINRPTETPLDQALPDIDGIDKLPIPLYFGGPVHQEQLLILLRSETPPVGSQKVLDDVYFTWRRDALEGLLKKQNPDKGLRIFSGYAGWGPGQLDREVRRGDWVIGKADSAKVFIDDPSDLWPEVFSLQKQIEVRGPSLIQMPSPS